MKQTLLEMTQSILSSLGSDEVNSISDTTESMQVAETIKQSYYSMLGRMHLPNHKQLVQLDPSLDPTTPVLMYVPAGIAKIESIKYFDNNVSSGQPIPGYKYVTILPVEQFLDITDGFNPDETDVFSFTFQDNSNNYPGGFTFYYKNTKQPQYCCVLSNYYVIFDGYDSTVDSTLQSSKTKCIGEVTPVWSMTDSFIPNLDDENFTLLLSEAKALAFFELKQSPHIKAEKDIKQGWSSLQRNKSIVNRPTYFDQLPNFGRRGYAGMSFFKRMGWDR